MYFALATRQERIKFYERYNQLFIKTSYGNHLWNNSYFDYLFRYSCFIARDRDEIHTSIAIKIVKTISATIVFTATICSLPAGIIYLFFFSSLAWWGQIFLSLLLLFVWYFVFRWVCSFFSN